MRIGLLIQPGFQVINYTPIAVFEVANEVSNGGSLYDVQLLSEDGGPVLNSLGMENQTKRIGDDAIDTIVVGAAPENLSSTPKMRAFLRECMGNTRRIVSMGVGAFTLAEAGILDGRRATTHWAYAHELQARFPKVAVQKDRIFIVDGPIWTSAGMTADIDMALGLIERDVGREVARETARTLVVHQRRAGGQSQHSTLLELDARSDRVQTALAFARANLREPLTVEQLAAAACLSPRQFSRVFRMETGQSPAKAIESLRLEAARLMLEQSRLPVEDVARETGFGERERMRRSLQRTCGQTARALRGASHPLAAI